MAPDGVGAVGLVDILFPDVLSKIPASPAHSHQAETHPNSMREKRTEQTAHQRLGEENTEDWLC